MLERNQLISRLETHSTVTRFSSLTLKILLTALSGFALWRSSLLVSWIVEHPHPVSVGASLIQSLRLNFYLLSIFVICFAWPVHRLLPDSYYEAVRSKSFASACGILKIELFRTFLRRTIWNRRTSKIFFFDGTRSGLAEYDNNTRRAEFIHASAFVTILAVSLYIGVAPDPLLAIGTGAVNVIWNFYPTILQRYQRSKLLAMRK